MYYLITAFGVDPKKMFYSFFGLFGYFRDFIKFNKQKKTSIFKFDNGFLFPCVADKFQQNGSLKGHYFYQDLYVARRVFEASPKKHVDIGSRVDGFVAHVAAFRKIEVIDIRPTKSLVQSISFIEADLMQPVNPELIEYCESLSCLHALEHFGLGRYGDEIDYQGYLKGLANLSKILKQGGVLYLSVPIGKPQVQFNAHRVFSVDHIEEVTSNYFKTNCFSYINDNGEFFVDEDLNAIGAKNSFECEFGCGIWELIKL